MLDPALRVSLLALVDRLENHYDFWCEGGPLRLCVEWQQLAALLRAEAPQDNLQHDLKGVMPSDRAARDSREASAISSVIAGVTHPAENTSLRAEAPPPDCHKQDTATRVCFYENDF